MDTFEIGNILTRKLLDFELRQMQRSWLRTVYSYMIDSGFRKYKQLDTFLKEQLDNPSANIKKLAISLRGRNADETIIKILRWVCDNIKYEYDSVNFGRVEYWATAEEIIDRKKGDCDDMNGLIYILARLAGISENQLFCAIGDVNGGGHFWCLYYDFGRDRLVSIDATYYPDFTPIKDRLNFGFSSKKYQGIWYLFNEKIILED